MRCSRREMLGVGIAAAAGALVGRRAAGADADANAPLPAPTPAVSQLKLSCAAYSLRDFLPRDAKPGRMTLHDFLDYAAGWRLDGVEPTSYYFSSEDKAYLHSLKARAFRLGLGISGTAVGNNFCLPPGEERDTQIALVNRWVDHSVEFGAPVIRIFAGRKHQEADDAQAFAWTIDCIKTCCDYAGSRGVFLGIENHGYLTQTGEDLLRILDAVNHEWLGVNLDSGNFIADPYGNMALVASRAVNVQVKVEQRTADGSGREPADFGRIAGILREAGYRGYVALEYEAKEDPMVAVPRYLEELRAAIS